MLLQQTQGETAAAEKPTGLVLSSDRAHLTICQLRLRTKERLLTRRNGGDGTWRLRGGKGRKARTPGGGEGEKKN